MSIKNLLKVAINAILSNKFRSFLSMLGIIIGVAAVIIMMAIGQGSKQSVRAELSKMGTNLLTLRPGADMRGGVRRDPSSMQTLKMADYQSLLSDATLVTHISPEVTSSGQVMLRDGKIREDKVNTNIQDAATALAALPKPVDD